VQPQKSGNVVDAHIELQLQIHHLKPPVRSPDDALGPPPQVKLISFGHQRFLWRFTWGGQN
jgi:hypothetical protein